MELNRLAAGRQLDPRLEACDCSRIVSRYCVTNFRSFWVQDHDLSSYEVCLYVMSDVLDMTFLSIAIITCSAHNKSGFADERYPAETRRLLTGCKLLLRAGLEPARST